MDLGKYKYYKFHKKKEKDNQIKVLLLKYDYEITKKGGTLKQNINLLEDWINSMLENEQYEYLEVFTYRLTLLRLVEKGFKVSINEFEYNRYKVNYITKLSMKLKDLYFNLKKLFIK